MVGSWSEEEQGQGDLDIWRVEASDPAAVVAVVVAAAAVPAVVAAVPAVVVAVPAVVVAVPVVVAAGTQIDHSEAGAGFDEDRN